MKRWVCAECGELLEDNSQLILKHQFATGHHKFNYRNIPLVLGRQTTIFEAYGNSQENDGYLGRWRGF